MKPSYYSKVSSTQKRTHFFLVWVMVFRNKSLCLGKVKVFFDNSNLSQPKSAFKICMATVNELCVFLTGFILYLKTFVAPDCFIKMFHSQQIQGILVSPWYNNSCCAQQELDKDDFYSFDGKGKKFLHSKLFTARLQEKLCLPN